MRLDHASRLATRWLADDVPAPWRELEGTAVLADLTGFTRLTEALAVLGREGSEVLHRALTLCFSTLLEPSLAVGGDIIGFAGDAALVWFDGDGHELRAVEAAAEMPASLGRLPAAVTGGRRLRVGVGVHTGLVTAVLAGSPQRGILWCGQEISALVALTSSAGAGQVVVSPTLADRLPRSWRGPIVGSGIEVRRRPARRATSTLIPAPPIADDMPSPGDEAAAAERLLSLLSPSVRELMTAGFPTGDHRAATIGFISVPGVDALLVAHGPSAVHDKLDRAITTIGRIAAELSITWLDTDVGVDSIKLILAAGVPQAVDDDEGRLLLALRRMLDESDVVLRAGAQRGRIFSGALGVPGRRTFTVLGDTVNVAARALGLAGDRELVVGDGLGVADRPFVTSVGLGAVALRNRVRPVQMWRVVTVAPGPPGDSTRSTATATATGERVAERERIETAWKRCVDGHGSSLTIIGEPGMGASELLAGAVERAGPAATFVIADRFRQQIPYGTIATIVRALSLAAAPDEPDEPDDGWSWLASFAPHVDDPVRDWLEDGRRALERQPRADELDPATTARRARAVLAALIGAAAPRPWLLAVDDLDAIDDASRRVLHELRALAERDRWLLLFGSSRGGSTSPTDAEGGPSDTIVLEALDESEAAGYVLDIEPRLRADQVARIVSAGRGNPFVLAELARDPHAVDLPDSLERLGTARIDALPITVRQLVRDASTFGMTIPLAIAATVLDRPELGAAEAWTEATTVLRPTGTGEVAFRHDAYRIAAHESLPFQRRRELHGSIADHLASLPGSSGAVVARHYQEAGRVREAFPLAVAAGRAAKAAGALVEASELLDRAVRMAREVDRRVVGELLVEAGDTLMHLGDLPGAERAFKAAARGLSDPLAYAALCSQRADLAIRRSHYRQARTWVKKGLSLAEPLATSAVEVRGKLLLDDAASLHFMGRNAESLRLATEALAAAEQVGSAYLEGLAHLHLEMVHSVLLRPEAGAHGDAAVRLFESIGHDRHLGEALSNSGLTAMHEGRWNEALARYRRAADVLARTGDTTDAAVVELNVGFVLLRQGRTEEADAQALIVLRTTDSVGLDLMGAYARHLRSRVAAVEGRPADAEELMAAARATFLRLGDTGMVVDCDVASIDRLLRAGSVDEALALACRIEDEISAADDAVEVSFQLFRGIAEARAGDVAGGAARIVGALDKARRHRLLYEEHSCLAALIDIEDDDGPSAPSGARAEREAIATSLGLATRPRRRSPVPGRSRRRAWPPRSPRG